MPKVRIGSILHSYTGGVDEVDAEGATLAEVIDDLDRRFPGLKFRVVDEQDRIRRHICFFVGTELADELAHRVAPDQTVHVLAALSGG